MTKVPEKKGPPRLELEKWVTAVQESISTRCKYCDRRIKKRLHTSKPESMSQDLRVFGFQHKLKADDSSRNKPFTEVMSMVFSVSESTNLESYGIPHH